jgi:5-formyltetrahydrofolate cyclo-ligase
MSGIKPDSYGSLKVFKDDLTIFSDMYLKGMDKVQAQKRVLRADMRKLRENIPDDLRNGKNTLLMQQMLETMDIKQADVILGYASYGNEPQTWLFLQEMLKQGKRVLLPRRRGDWIS